MNNNIDDAVEREIERCLDLESPRSFFLFAGAGSGKTLSLVNALNYINNKYRDLFLSQGKYVGVITYTNAACDEIIHRTHDNPIFHISTIHGFCWSIIQGFNEDIRAFIKDNLILKIQGLNAKITGVRDTNTSKCKKNVHSLEKAKKRLAELDSIYEFTYNPNSNSQFGKDSLSHTEVISLTTHFLQNKPIFQSIFVQKYPFLLIDESQDTHKELIEVLLELEDNYKSIFLLGLIGDDMQRIYSQGKSDLPSIIKNHWQTPQKKMNHRSQKRIIELANNIRGKRNGIEQLARDDKQGGHVHLFILNNTDNNTLENEVKICCKMAEITHDELWNKEGQVKKLYLEHRMAAIQQDFIELYDIFHNDNKYNTLILEGTITELSFFSKLITPLMEALLQNDNFVVMELIRNSSTILKGIESPLTLAETVTTETLTDTKKSVQKLADLFFSNININIIDILTILEEEKIFTIPPKLDEAFQLYKNSIEIQSKKIEEETVWIKFLTIPYQQLINYTKYINDETSYATHHGVKGLEFDRVMVVMNDKDKRGRGGLSASYEKLFGVVAESETDIRNKRNGKETDLQRTRRLFYVTCTRAKQSLALVAYTNSPEILKYNMLERKWFDEKEITIL
ncbi:ATP-dependent helicase [Frischella perrara]|uniref:DNA 3'-5' helicase n=1 Tax=Frischella perrara TaxID=1267021 RepID=A0A318MSP0_FRIPE|nr:UvrD-helicase domain-containing protein [Frischella perrara]PXY95551.1 ATP-dependent helicase [Frischella perrara]